MPRVQHLCGNSGEGLQLRLLLVTSRCHKSSLGQTSAQSREIWGTFTIFRHQILQKHSIKMPPPPHIKPENVLKVSLILISTSLS